MWGRVQPLLPFGAEDSVWVAPLFRQSLFPQARAWAAVTEARWRRRYRVSVGGGAFVRVVFTAAAAIPRSIPPNTRWWRG